MKTHDGAPKPPAPRRADVAVALAVPVVLALGVLFGTEPTSLSNAWNDPASADRAHLVALRPPHVLLAAVSGAGLAGVGAAFQALLRNPLAEPYVLGVSGGAALGASIAIVLGISATTLAGAAVLPLAAFAGGLGATALVYMVARGGGDDRGRVSILLAGVMVNAVASALISFFKAAVAPSRAQQLLRWLAGFVDLPTTPALAIVSGCVALGSAVIVLDAPRLNLLALGDDAAGSLGVDVRALERRTFLACSFVVGAIVSLTGLIGFVGLVVPHALRRVFGADHRRIVPMSLAAGAVMVVACDLAARLVFRVLDTDLPVGAVTAVLGGPLFLLLLRRRGA